jgi:hypothetical protein
MTVSYGSGGAPVYDPAATATSGPAPTASSQETVATGYVNNGTVDGFIQGGYQNPLATPPQDAFYDPNAAGYAPPAPAFTDPAAGNLPTGYAPPADMSQVAGYAMPTDPALVAGYAPSLDPGAAAGYAPSMDMSQAAGYAPSMDMSQAAGYAPAFTDPAATPFAPAAAAGAPASGEQTALTELPGAKDANGGFKVTDTVLKSGGQAVSRDEREEKKEARDAERSERSGRSGGGSVGGGGGGAERGDKPSSGKSKGDKTGTGLLYGTNYAQVAGDGAVIKKDQALGNTDTKITGNDDIGTMTKTQTGAWSENAVRSNGNEWSASGSGSFGVNAQAGASYTVGPIALDTSGKAYLVAEGRGSARFSANPPLIQVGAEARVAVGVEGRASGAIGPLRGEVSGYAMGGAEATVGGSIGVLKPNEEEKAAGVTSKIGAECKAGAFAGAKAGGEGTAEFPGGSVTAGGGVRAGVGAEIGAKFGMTTDKSGRKKLGGEFNMGASLGIGFDIKFGLKVDITGIINAGKAVDKFASKMLGPVWGYGKAVVGFIGKKAWEGVKTTFKAMTFLPKKFWGGVMNVGKKIGGFFKGLFGKKPAPPPPVSKSSQTVLKDYAAQQGKTFKEVKNDANDYFEKKAGG